ncbi:MAG: pyruvate kinase [Alphaproteobacteria bacterium]|nr:pyruvate kinase [Alphaproteobacteria bacterium]
MRRNRQTKILATIGPVTANQEMIDSLFCAGVDLFRLNFSHGKVEDHQAVCQYIRAVEEKYNHPIGIVADLQGPKLRIGKFKNDSIELQKGQTFRFDSNNDLGDETRVYLPHQEVIEAMEEGSQIFLDDGKVRIRITKKGKDYLEGEVRSGSKLSNNKGFNLPNVVLPIPALTEKDKADLKMALDMEVDWIAQSFVQRPHDVLEARNLIKAYKKNSAALMVKIEKPSALEHLQEIVDLADGVMLARGDLGVEIPPEDVPAVQKNVVRMVREMGKPVVVATQMLESMIDNARPTRAEASDVATAVYDGADCVMLSAETAAGKYPIQAVEMMDRIARRTEHDENYQEMMETSRVDALHTPSDAITTAAYYVAQDVEAKLIVNYTMSGSTALRTAKQRPNVPILCLTPEKKVARRLVLSYGIYPVHNEIGSDDLTGPARHAGKIALEQEFLNKGDRFVMTAGVPFGVSGTTNILRIAEA